MLKVSYFLVLFYLFISLHFLTLKSCEKCFMQHSAKQCDFLSHCRTAFQVDAKSTITANFFSPVPRKERRENSHCLLAALQH